MIHIKRIDNKKNLYKSIVLLVILAIGIGYAYLTSNLSITGATEVVANTWNIHFENLSVSTGSVTATTPASIQSNNVDITYAITLSRPRDFYEFTVDVKNDGTLPGKVSISTLNGITTDAEPIIDYSINYTNGNPVNVGDILNAGTKKSIKVRVYYKDDISSNDLPTSNLNLNLTYTLQYVQSEEDEPDATEQMIALAANNECMYKYEGQVTDEVGVTKTAENVYYNRCADKRNIKFAGYCWQIIRTTETGGIKMIYNGEPDSNGKCGSSRSEHRGIIGTQGSTESLNAEYLYGTTFTYNTTTSEFTLVDTTSTTWSNSTYQNLLGKFTCKNISGTCTTLYSVNGYSNATTAYTSSYTIGDTNYASIGTSAYNANNRSPAMVGYMFNKVYNWVANSAPTVGSLMGNDVSYSNGTYTLLPADGESELGTTLDATHHYTCNTTSSICTKVRYYYYSSGSYYNYYIELDGVENIQEAINEMLYNNDVNTYNSSIKGIIDSWYAQNLSTKTSMLEDTVYCNARNITNQNANGWNKDGGLTTKMQFKNYNLNNDISCANETDQFTVSNNKAKLEHSVSLSTHEELYTLTNNNSSTYYNVLTKTNEFWLGLSPFYFDVDHALVRYVYTYGRVDSGNSVSGAYVVRPVVSLARGVMISSGTGSEADPFIMQE